MVFSFPKGRKEERNFWNEEEASSSSNPQKILKIFCEEICLFSGDDDAKSLVWLSKSWASSPIQSFFLCSKKISKEKNGVFGNEEEEVLPAYQRTSSLKKIQYTILKR